jgi:hypothetical protein
MGPSTHQWSEMQGD